jgi:hypothetical protein
MVHRYILQPIKVDYPTPLTIAAREIVAMSPFLGAEVRFIESPATQHAACPLVFNLYWTDPEMLALLAVEG